MHPPRPYRQTGCMWPAYDARVRTGYDPARDTRACTLWAAAEHVRQHMDAGDFRWSVCLTIFEGPVALNLGWSLHACENTRVAHLESLAAREREPGRILAAAPHWTVAAFLIDTPPPSHAPPSPMRYGSPAEPRA
jgi:hypothetical protein